MCICYQARAQLKSYLWGAKANRLRRYGYFVPDFEGALCRDGVCQAPAEDETLADVDVGLDVASIEDRAFLEALGN